MRAVNILWASREFVKSSWLKGFLTSGRFSHAGEWHGLTCRPGDGSHDLFGALQGWETRILLVNFKAEDSSCGLEVALKMLNLSQSDNQWNISCSVRQEQPWSFLWARKLRNDGFLESLMGALGSFRLAGEIIVSVLEPEMLTFKW